MNRGGIFLGVALIAVQIVILQQFSVESVQFSGRAEKAGFCQRSSACTKGLSRSKARRIISL